MAWYELKAAKENAYINTGKISTIAYYFNNNDYSGTLTVNGQTFHYDSGSKAEEAYEEIIELLGISK